MSNAQITRNTKNMTMRLPLDLIAHAKKIAPQVPLKQTIVTTLRVAWGVPEKARENDQ